MNTTTSTLPPRVGLTAKQRRRILREAQRGFHAVLREKVAKEVDRLADELVRLERERERLRAWMAKGR